MEKIYPLNDICSSLNNASFDQEIVVCEGIRPFDKIDSFPLRLDALILILCTEGTGKIGIDLREYDVQKNTLIVVQPQNYIYLSDISGDCRANVVCCSRYIIEEVLPRLTDLLPLIIHHRSEPVIYLKPHDAESLNGFFRFLKEKISGPRTPFLKQKLQCVLQAALFEMMDIEMTSNNLSRELKTRKEEIMAKFILAISENFRTHRRVTFYAERLCITPKHLSTVVKEISGRTAGEWIENYVMIEAKVLLKSTDLTIQEIASRLNFTNQSFFGKYFKHQTGMSPTEFRHRHS